MSTMSITIGGKSLDVVVQLCDERLRVLHYAGQHGSRAAFAKENGYKIINWKRAGDSQWRFAMTYADMLRNLRGCETSSCTQLRVA